MRLTTEDARALFATQRLARLATAGRDGHPHVFPLTFAVERDRICTSVDNKPKTTPNMQQQRNIAENPRVALLADHYEDDWTGLWWVRADGHASIVTDDNAMRPYLDLLAERYEQYRQARPAGPVIVIEAERWTGWTGKA